MKKKQYNLLFKTIMKIASDGSSPKKSIPDQSRALNIDLEPSPSLGPSQKFDPGPGLGPITRLVTS